MSHTDSNGNESGKIYDVHNIVEAGYTVEQAKKVADLINGARKKIEDDILESLDKKLKRLAYVVGAIATLYGVAALATIRSAVIEAAGKQLSSDSSVQEKAAVVAAERLQEVQKLLKETRELKEKVKEAHDESLHKIDADFEDLKVLAERLRKDIAPPSSSSSQGGEREPGTEGRGQ